MRLVEVFLFSAFSLFEILATLLLAPLTLPLSAGVLLATIVIRLRMKKKSQENVLWTGPLKLGA
jgi:hypothetical protein